MANPSTPAAPPYPTRADWRDISRRWVEIVPPIDTATGAAGALPTGQPNPDNPTLNQCINAGIDLINHVCCCGEIKDLTPIEVSAAPPYKRGVQYQSYAGSLGPVGTSIVNVQIADVFWEDANGNFTRLQPYNWYSDDPGNPAKFRPFPQHAQQPVPESYIVVGTQVGLIPPPNQGGMLTLSVVTGLPQLSQDTDAIISLPYPFLDLIGYLAVILLSARTIRDVDMSTRAQQFMPIVTEGLTALYNWKGGSDPGGLNRVLDMLRMVTNGGINRMGQPAQSSQGGSNGQ